MCVQSKPLITNAGLRGKMASVCMYESKVSPSSAHMCVKATHESRIAQTGRKEEGRQERRTERKEGSVNIIRKEEKERKKKGERKK